MSCMIYVVRHGETYWNAEHKMQGQINIPLNEKGQAQAKAAAEKLDHIRFDIAYSSPLSRAHDTAAAILAGKGVPLVDNALLLEQSYGLSEAADQKGFYDPSSPLYGYMDDPVNYKPDIGAESFEQLLKRAEKVVEQIIIPAEGLYRNVLIAGHGAIICGIFDVVEGNELKDFWKPMLPNCGVGCLKVENGKAEVISL